MNREGAQWTVDRVPVTTPSKSIRVKREMRLYDSKYKRYYRKTYHRWVHYEGSLLKVGDLVTIYTCKLISGHKSAICYDKGLKN